MKFTFILLLILSTNLIFSQTELQEDKKELLDVFVGEWEGTATAFFEREPERENRIEEISMVCKKILKGNYIRCESKWTNTKNGRVRDLVIYWNYDRRSDNYDILFLYDNWPGKVNYKLEYDKEATKLTGGDTFTASGNIPAEEKVEWVFSDNGNEIISREFNHYETDPDDYWAKSFEFVLERK